MTILDRPKSVNSLPGKSVRIILAIFPVLLLAANGVVYYSMHLQNVWLEGDSSWRSDTFVLAHRWAVPIASAVFLTLAVIVVALTNIVFLLYFTSRGKSQGNWLPGCVTGIVSAVISIMLFS